MKSFFAIYIWGTCFLGSNYAIIPDRVVIKAGQEEFIVSGV